MRYAWITDNLLSCLQGNVAADGSLAGSVRRWQQQADAEKELQAAEEAVQNKDKVRCRLEVGTSGALQHSGTDSKAS